MKTTIFLLIGLAFIIWSGTPKMTLHPFSLHFETWRNMLGLLFLILSLSFFQMHHEKIGKEKALKIVKEVFEDYTSEKASAEKRENDDKPESSINTEP